jgi:hypothetical protein
MEANTRVAKSPREMGYVPSRASELEKSKTFTVTIDRRLDEVLDQLKDDLGKTSRAEIFRMAIALLKIASEERKQGKKLTVASANDKVEKEIVLA